jgi:hypothetical protein
VRESRKEYLFSTAPHPITFLLLCTGTSSYFGFRNIPLILQSRLRQKYFPASSSKRSCKKKRRNPLNPLIHILQRISPSGNSLYSQMHRLNPSIAFNIHHGGLAHRIVPSTFPLFGSIYSTTDAWYRKR